MNPESLTMPDTTNTEPPLRAAFEAWAAKDEPPYKLERAPDPFIYAWGSTACAWKAFEAGAAHAVAQRQGEPAAWLYDTDMADLAAGKNARVYPVDAKPHYKDTDRVVRFYTAPATAEQPAEPTDVDWRGLALDLEARAKTVESQTTERAMLAAAHGLRLMGSATHQPERAGVVPGWKLVRQETLMSWKDEVNTIATLSNKSERYGHAIELKQAIADVLYAAPPAPAAENPTTSDSPEYTAGWKAGYKHGAWGGAQQPAERKPLTRQQLREAFHRHTGCTLGNDIGLAEHVCTVVERTHGIGIPPADAKEGEA